MKKIYCCKCGVELNGGYFNAPSGAHCCDCWENKPTKQKDKDLVKALSARIMLAKKLKP